MPLCQRCGSSNPQKMIGLMTLWFGPFIDLRPDHGYFHLCPACYRAHVLPHLDHVQGKLKELHPIAARHLGSDGRVLHDDDPAPDQPSATGADTEAVEREGTQVA